MSFPSECPIIDITKCTSLKSIHFQGIKTCSENESSNEQFVQQILAQAPSSLEELSLNFARINDEGGSLNLEIKVWNGVAKLLEETRFNKLKRIYFEWPGFISVTGSEKDRFLKAFSQIRKRGKMIESKVIYGKTSVIIIAKFSYLIISIDRWGQGRVYDIIDDIHASLEHQI